jgi:molybdate transport system substrate-binding protein
MRPFGAIIRGTIVWVGLAILGVANATDLIVLSANGMKEAMQELKPVYEKEKGGKLQIGFGNLGTLVKRVQGGGTADVVVMPRQGIEQLVKSGHAIRETTTDVARSGIGVAVRKGAPKPDISTPDAFKRALLAAKSITYLDPAGGGTSGIHVVRVLERLGIAEEVKSRILLQANALEAGNLVAKGDAEIGINLIQEFLPQPGIELVGPLPGDLQNTLVFSAAVLAEAKDKASAQGLIAFLRTAQSASIVRAKGMESVD